MPWVEGSDQREHWRRMDVPPWVGTCQKFQQGRLLMQRYQFVASHATGHATYEYHVETVTNKSRVLAGRMIEHARNCAVCTRENRLGEEDFYGVYK